MKQYEYQLINKQSGRVEHVRATAKTPTIARNQIVLTYGQQFEVLALFSNINPPHHVLGEIDCSDFPDSDIQWLADQAAKIERVTHDAITDTIVSYLADAGRDTYLVFSESDPDLTVELDDGLIVAKIKGAPVVFTGEVIDRALPIFSNPSFDYK
jgi:hypothetical protein